MKKPLAGLLLLAVGWLGGIPAAAQPAGHRLPLVATLFNNATLLPGAGKLGVFGIPVHPGVSVGTEFRYNRHPANELFQSLRLAYHYHQYVQHSIQLYSEFGYRHHFPGRFDVGPRLGVGYLHSIPDMQRFELNASGEYERKRDAGRPQAMVSLTAEVGYALKKQEEGPIRVFLAYQFYMQMPFVQKYVPLLPNTALHVGIAVPFWQTKKESR